MSYQGHRYRTPGEHNSSSRRLSNTKDSFSVRKDPHARDRRGKPDSDLDDEPVRDNPEDHPTRGMNPSRRSMQGSSHGGSRRGAASHDIGDLMDDLSLHSHGDHGSIQGGPRSRRSEGRHTMSDFLDNLYGDVDFNSQGTRAGRVGRPSDHDDNDYMGDADVNPHRGRAGGGGMSRPGRHKVWSCPWELTDNEVQREFERIRQDFSLGTLRAYQQEVEGKIQALGASDDREESLRLIKEDIARLQAGDLPCGTRGREGYKLGPDPCILWDWKGTRAPGMGGPPRHGGLEDYDDERSDYPPSRSRRGHYHPSTGHGRYPAR